MERKENKLQYGIIFVNDTNVIERLVTNINQNIQFVDVNNWKVYEHYEINNRKTMRELGVLDSIHCARLLILALNQPFLGDPKVI